MLLQLLPVLIVAGAIAVAYVRTTMETRHSVDERIHARLAARQETTPAAEPLPEVASVAALRERTVDAEFARARKAAAEPTEADLIAERVARLEAANLDATTVLRVGRALRLAADNGKREAVVYHFPAELLSDRGRAANNAAAETLSTLRGLPLEIARYLSDRGFRISIYVADYRENGVPGDTALVARWA